MRYVKFSPEEMAIDAADIDVSKAFFIRGEENMRLFREWRKRVAALDPDVRKAFPTDAAVNQALRLAIKKNGKSASTRKKSA